MSARWRRARPSFSPTATRRPALKSQPFMIIGMIGSTRGSPDDRGRFAQQIATTIPGVRDGRITMSEPVRIDGQPGYETRIDAISGKDNTPVTIVQWLRFGSGDLAAHHRQLRRATNGPRHFRASAPCATASSRAAERLRKFARRAETSGFRSYTNGTSTFARRVSLNRETNHAESAQTCSDRSRHDVRRGPRSNRRFGPHRSSPTRHPRCS